MSDAEDIGTLQTEPASAAADYEFAPLYTKEDHKPEQQRCESEGKQFTVRPAPGSQD